PPPSPAPSATPAPRWHHRFILPMTEQDRQTLAIMGRAAFWTFTVIALPAALLTTVAWFSNSHVILSQLSPFRVQYAVLLAAHAIFCLLLRRTRWAALFAAFALF